MKAEETIRTCERLLGLLRRSGSGQPADKEEEKRFHGECLYPLWPELPVESALSRLR